MSDRQKEVKDLLRKHDYITVVQKTGDGCVVTYPYPKLLYQDREPRPRLVECFAIQRGNEPGLWVNTSYDRVVDGKFVDERFIPVPEYALRLYLACEISACNMKIPLHPAMAVFVSESNEDCGDLEKVISGPSVEAEANKEGFLFGLFFEARNDGFPSEYEEVATTHGVAEGYNLLKSFYKF